MAATKIGDRVIVLSTLASAPNSDSAATVCAIETSYILLEIIGQKDQWGDPVRRWFEKGLFVEDSQGIVIMPGRKNDDA